MEKEVKDFIDFVEKTDFKNASYFALKGKSHGHHIIECTQESAIEFAAEILKGAHHKREYEWELYSFKPKIDEFDFMRDFDGIKIVKEKPVPPHLKNNNLFIYKIKLIALGSLFTIALLFLAASLIIGGSKVIVYLIGLI